MRRTSSALLLPLVAAVVLATALVAGAAASSATSVQITTPKYGSTVHLGASPYTAVAGTVSFAAATPQATRFYLRRDDCGGSNDNPHLSVVNGTDAGDGCGLVLTSVVGLGGDVDHGAFVDVPSYAASVNQAVQVSLDDASFSSPIPARISGSSWSVAIPTPAVGKHTLYAESTQGFDTSAPASTTFTVKK